MVGGSDAHPFLSIAAVLALALTQPAPLAASTLPVQYQQAQDVIPQNCREFTATVMIGGQPQQAVGQACRQPDGSWRITQDAPGLPPLVYTLPPEAIYAPPYPYPDYWANPWIFGPPFFIGGSVFFADRFHHFNRRDGFRHFDGFHRGFHRDFHRGFGPHADGRFHGGGHGGGHGGRGGHR
jgi:surface antigen